MMSWRLAGREVPTLAYAGAFRTTMVVFPFAALLRRVAPPRKPRPIVTGYRSSSL